MITLSNAMSYPSQEDDGSYSFLIAGSLTEEDIKSLQDATLLMVSLDNSSITGREVILAPDTSFQKALLRYF